MADPANNNVNYREVNTLQTGGKMRYNLMKVLMTSLNINYINMPVSVMSYSNHPNTDNTGVTATVAITSKHYK